MAQAWWNKVTWYSKLLAMILFTALPFLGFYFGFLYGKGSAGVEIIAVKEPQAGATSPGISGQAQEPASTSAPIAAPSAPEYKLSLSYPYPVSWQEVNGATVTLTNIFIGNTTNNQGKQFYSLVLTTNVAAGFGGFCTSAFGSYGLRMILDELGNAAVPTVLDDNCTPSHSTLYNQRVAFPVSKNDKTFTISVNNPDGTQQTFFIIRIMNDGTLRLEAAPTRG
jgi:hypothetical protein